MMPTPYSVYAVHAQKAMTRYGTSKDSSLNKWVIGKAFWMGLSMGCLKVKTILLGSSNGRPMEVHEQGSLARTPRQNMTQVNWVKILQVWCNQGFSRIEYHKNPSLGGRVRKNIGWVEHGTSFTAVHSWTNWFALITCFELSQANWCWTLDSRPELLSLVWYSMSEEEHVMM